MVVSSSVSPPGQSSWTRTRPPDVAPSLHRHYSDFITTTSDSAPVPRIGTQVLVGSPLERLPWHRDDWFPQFRRKARIRLTPEEIALHDQHLARLTTATSPTLCEGFGVGAHTAAELLIIFGDNPDRIRSEAAFAKLCGACPIPASSGMTTGRHRLNRGGHRHANAALYRAVIVRMQFHQPTRDYVARRIAAGRTKRDIIRCLKRFLAREIYQRVMTDFRARQEIIQAA